jgi:2,5-dioxopentanoate dehydrogenase
VELKGISLIAGKPGAAVGAAFHAVNPESGELLEPQFISSTREDVDLAAQKAHQAFLVYRRLSGRQRGQLLRSIADGLDAAAGELTTRAQLETALPQARLQGEVKRTSNQLRAFAELVEEGSWVAARIDTSLPDRKPLPRPDLRSMLRPIGPVAVFGASNFPLAFSVAGGDTASALAAGNPVIVKAHPAHPGTSEIAARVIFECLQACDLPPGVFSLLFDTGIEIGKTLVQHPLICAVGFTGSQTAGRALMDLAAQRPHPIPCFAEMGSTNPVFVLSGALRDQGGQLAARLHSSFTLAAGQMCTKPGLVFLPDQAEAETFVSKLRRLTTSSAAFTLLTPGIAANYHKSLQRQSSRSDVELRVAPADAGTCTAPAALLETRIEDFLKNPELSHEIFGPSSFVIRYGQREAMMLAAESLDGHLTATVIGSVEDLAEHRDLIEILERKVGRVIVNGVPTGVEVSHAMVHGGPYPATSDSRFTAVGSPAILRFARPVCYQNFPESLLPDELRDANPLHILRMLNGRMTSEPVES